MGSDPSSSPSPSSTPSPTPSPSPSQQPDPDLSLPSSSSSPSSLSSPLPDHPITSNSTITGDTNLLSVSSSSLPPLHPVSASHLSLCLTQPLPCRSLFVRVPLSASLCLSDADVDVDTEDEDDTQIETMETEQQETQLDGNVSVSLPSTSTAAHAVVLKNNDSSPIQQVKFEHTTSTSSSSSCCSSSTNSSSTTDNSSSSCTWWHCSYGCGKRYKKSSGRSIRRHVVSCFRAHWPGGANFTDKELSALIANQQDQGLLVTGLRRWRMRQSRRLASELAEHEKWKCPWNCGQFYRSTSSRSIQRHATACPRRIVIQQTQQEQQTYQQQSPMQTEQQHQPFNTGLIQRAAGTSLTSPVLATIEPLRKRKRERAAANQPQEKEADRYSQCSLVKKAEDEGTRHVEQDSLHFHYPQQQQRFARAHHVDHASADGSGSSGVSYTSSYSSSSFASSDDSLFSRPAAMTSTSDSSTTDCDAQNATDHEDALGNDQQTSSSSPSSSAGNPQTGFSPMTTLQHLQQLYVTDRDEDDQYLHADNSNTTDGAWKRGGPHVKVEVEPMDHQSSSSSSSSSSSLSSSSHPHASFFTSFDLHAQKMLVAQQLQTLVRAVYHRDGSSHPVFQSPLMTPSLVLKLLRDDIPDEQREQQQQQQSYNNDPILPIHSDQQLQPQYLSESHDHPLPVNGLGGQHGHGQMKVEICQSNRDHPSMYITLASPTASTASTCSSPSSSSSPFSSPAPTVAIPTSSTPAVDLSSVHWTCGCGQSFKITSSKSIQKHRATCELQHNQQQVADAMMFIE